MKPLSILLVVGIILEGCHNDCKRINSANNKMIAAGYPDKKILENRKKNARAIRTCNWALK